MEKIDSRKFIPTEINSWQWKWLSAGNHHSHSLGKSFREWKCILSGLFQFHFRNGNDFVATKEKRVLEQINSQIIKPEVPPATPAQSSGSCSSSQLQNTNPMNNSIDIYLLISKSTHHPTNKKPRATGACCCEKGKSISTVPSF